MAASFESPTQGTDSHVQQSAGHTGEQDHAALLQLAAHRMPILARVLKLATKRLAADFSAQVSKIGEGQFRVLHVLYDDGTLQVGELATRCGVADPTISKMLKNLEHQNLVERHTDRENRRIVWVGITAEGRALFDKLQAHFEAGLAQFLQGLSAEQLRDLLRTMDHLEQLVAAAERGRERDVAPPRSAEAAS